MYDIGKLILKWDVDVEILSPVHVWTGKNLMVDVDLIFEGNKVHILSMDKLVKTFYYNYRWKIDLSRIEPKFVINYLRRIRKLHEAYTYSLEVKGNIPARLEYLKRLGCHVETSNVKEHYKVNGKFFIPASEIKGLLRTAILYNYYTSDPRNLKYLLEHVKTDITSMLAQIQFSRRQVARDIKQFDEELVSQALRRGSGLVRVPPVDILQNLMVLEYPEYAETSGSLRLMEIYEKGKNTPSYALPLETLDEGSKLKYKVQVLRRFDFIKGEIPDEAKSLLEYCRTIIGDRNKIVEALRKFSLDLLNFELERIREFKLKVEGEIKKLYGEVEGKLGEYLKEVNENPNTAILKIGFGTGHMYKTLDLILFKHDRKLYNQLCNLMSQVYGRTWDLLTVKVDMHARNMFGFIRLKFT